VRIIGIDPGTGILGFGVIDVQGNKTKLVTAGVITTPAHTPLADRLEEMRDAGAIGAVAPRHLRHAMVDGARVGREL